MGFFSWITQDTNESIANSSSIKETFAVIMMDDKGNTFFEKNYDGYGVFGGKDYFVLFAEMNGLTGENEDKLRDKGIDLYYDDTTDKVYPNLVESTVTWDYKNVKPEDCPDQGYFYSEEVEDFEDEDNWDRDEDENY